MPGDNEHTTEPDEKAWPVELADAGEVRRWISSALPGRPEVIGPLMVHQSKEWGVTASFAATGPQAREVVFKAASHPCFSAAPRVYALLSRHCAASVPELLAWQELKPSETWSLFAPFEGVTVASLRTREALLELARTFGRVQAVVASLPPGALAGLPRAPVDAIPGYFAAVLRDLTERQQPLWRGRAADLAKQFALPNDTAERLAQFREDVLRWTDELARASIPASLDHVDLHWDNAIVQSNGQILIYDWEEAVVSCPFFSLDRLLNDARELDLGEEAAWSGVAGRSAFTTTEQALRDAYLETVPWGTVEGRAHALDLALCLAPIKTAYEGIAFANALGWAHEPSLVAAWTSSRMLARWPAQASR